jgi:hypothetical protein
MPIGVRRDASRKFPDKVRPFRAGTDHAHVAAQNIEQLRQLVNGRAAKQSAYGAHAVVAFNGPPGARLVLVYRGKGAELVQRELAATEAHSSLTEEHVWAALNLYGDGGHKEQRRQQNDRQSGNRDIERTLCPPWHSADSGSG